MMRVENTIAFAEVHKKVGEWFAEITPVRQTGKNEVIRGSQSFDVLCFRREKAELFSRLSPEPMTAEQYKELGKSFVYELIENEKSNIYEEYCEVVAVSFENDFIVVPTLKMMWRDKRYREIDYLRDYLGFENLIELTRRDVDPHRCKSIGEYSIIEPFDYYESLKQAQQFLLALEVEPQQSPETPLISNEAEQIADSPAPAQTSASGKKTGKAGRPKAGHGNFLDFIIKETEEEKEAFLTKLHSQIDGNKGKVAGQTIRVCVKLGVMLKPSFKDMVNEFGDIGARKGYESYVDGLDTNGCECEVSNEYRAKVITTLGLK